jgi:hypothetical protein
MRNFQVKHFLPILLLPLLIAGGCQKKPERETIAVEKDVTQKNGTVQKEWVVEEIVPIPPKKADTVAGKRPSTEHIWVPGSWEHTGKDWEWKAGGWEKPPHSQDKWLKGHWGWGEEKWHWKPGHWIDPDVRLVVASVIEAPALIPETVPDKPVDKNHWVAGYWDWDGHWLWVPGYWTNKPDPEAEWVPGHWENFGLDAGFRWISGHWAIVE